MSDEACPRCASTGLVEASVWKWQSERWLPCPNGCTPPPLSKRTRYECQNPACGKSSLWTGDLRWRHPGDHKCSACGMPYTMVDETTGERYKVTFEHVGIYSQTWVPAEKEHISRRQAVDQFRQLKEREASGEEPIRNVHLFHATVEWREIEPDQAQDDGAVLP